MATVNFFATNKIAAQKHIHNLVQNNEIAAAFGSVLRATINAVPDLAGPTKCYRITAYDYHGNADHITISIETETLVQ